MSNDEILQRMADLLRQHTIPVERTYMAGRPSKYLWTDHSAEEEFLALFELLRSSFISYEKREKGLP